MAMQRYQEDVEKALWQSGVRIEQQNNFGPTFNLALGGPGTYNVTLNSFQGRQANDDVRVAEGSISSDGTRLGQVTMGGERFPNPLASRTFHQAPNNVFGTGGQMLPGGNNDPFSSLIPIITSLPQGNSNTGPAPTGHSSAPASISGMNNNNEIRLRPIAILLPSNANGTQPMSNVRK